MRSKGSAPMTSAIPPRAALSPGSQPIRPLLWLCASGQDMRGAGLDDTGSSRSRPGTDAAACARSSAHANRPYRPDGLVDARACPHAAGSGVRCLGIGAARVAAADLRSWGLVRLAQTLFGRQLLRCPTPRSRVRRYRTVSSRRGAESRRPRSSCMLQVDCSVLGRGT